MSKVVTISIGNELLNGATLDTNAYWLAQQFFQLGYSLERKYTIPDREKELIHILDQEIGKVEIIIMTGGLGPTSDDLTQSILANYFKSPVEKNIEWYEHLKKVYMQRRGEYQEHNLRQAWLPIQAEMIRNNLGTAPGTLFRKNNTLIFSLPGVPFEMKNMFSHEVLQIILKECPLNFVKIQKSILISGIGESDLAFQLKDWEKQLPSSVTIAYLPGIGYLKLNLMVQATSEKEANKILEKNLSDISSIIDPYKVNEIGVSFAESILKLFIDKQQAIGFVESCTGGLFSNEMTNYSGASSVFKGGIIAYTNEIKQSLVGVNPVILANYGAVSKETVIEMAEKGREQLKVDYCLSISGILGPEGGSEEQPVGTVYMAVATPTKTIYKKFHLGYERLQNKILAVNYGWNLLKENI